MPLGWGAVAGRILGLAETFGQTEQTLAEFIAGPDQTGLPGHVQNQYRRRCREFANLPGWVQNLNAQARRSIDNQCTPYWVDNGWDGPQASGAPTVQGGQCQGTNYDWTAIFVNADGTTFPFNRIDPGPITYTVEPAQVDCTNDPQGRPQQPLVVVQANGNNIVANGNYCGNSFPLQSLTATPSPPTAPNDCGDFVPDPNPVPGPVPPPDPGPNPAPDPEDNPDDPFDPEVPIPPYDDPIYGPIPFNLPSIPTSGGEGGPGPLDTAEGGPESLGPESTLDTDPAGDNGEADFGPPPAGRVWIGVAVRCLKEPGFGVMPNSEPQNGAFPRVVGNVSLRHGTIYSRAERIESEWTVLVRESGALEVDGVKVNVLPLWTVLIRPISAPACPENNCPQEV